jgi:transposase-like protein
MTKLEDIDTGALREALAGATDPKAVKRLMIALAYNDGVPVETLSERYGIARSTVYFWLNRFEGGSIAGAIYDDHRSGRPPSLDEREREHSTECFSVVRKMSASSRRSGRLSWFRNTFSENMTSRIRSDIFDGSSEIR